MALRRFVQVGQLLLELLDDRQYALGVLQKHLAAVGQRHRLIPVDQHRLELVFQAFDLRGYGRLSQVEELAGFAEAHRFGDGQ